MKGEHLAIVENGKIYLWSEPSNPAELSSDSMAVWKSAFQTSKRKP